MQTTPKEEYTHIHIDTNGYWYTQKKRIVNNNVLAYFKKNLHRDAKGIYILNTFGELAEKGYITVNGPIFEILKCSMQNIHIETRERSPFEPKLLVVYQDNLYYRIEDLQGYAIFSPKVATEFYFLLEPKENGFALGSTVIPTIQKIQWDCSS